MIEKELKTADCIKDRLNRKCVQRCLKIILEVLSNLKKIGENGLFIFVGIDNNDNEIVKIMVPPMLSKYSYYRCCNKFHTWKIEEFYKIQVLEKIQILILINGDDALVYTVSLGGMIKLLNRTCGLLIKRQRKGGQSSIRFARLAEESRHSYLCKVIDLLVKSEINTTTKIVISGSRELGQDLEKLLIKRSWKDACYFDKWINFDFTFVKRNEAEILKFFDSLERNQKEIEIKNFIDRIADNSNFVCYHEDLKDKSNDNFNSIKRIICNEDIKRLDWWPKEKIYIVNMDSPLYVVLKRFGGLIAECYKNF